MDYSNKLLEKLSIYLNNYSDYINDAMIKSLMDECNIDKTNAFIFLLCSILDIDMDKDRVIYDILCSGVKLLDNKDYINNPYYRNIKIDNIESNRWQYKKMSYKPYEAFVYNDLVKIDNMLVPQIGFFDKEYRYPCVMENDREWMLITPNEINTMNKAINIVFGNILTYGLGLGYFPYMCSLKDNVDSITIVERDIEVIELFNKYILPQFEYKEKIHIIQDDAFNYELNNNIKYDYVFVDIYHDPSDGVDIYNIFKKIERKDRCYLYWIEDTIKCYI